MLRRLYGVAVVVSLIICVGAAVLWGVSYDGHNSLIRTRYLPPDPDIPGRDFTPAGVRLTEVVGVIDGEFVLAVSRAATRGVRPTSGWHLFMLPSPQSVGDDRFLRRAGFELTKQRTPQGKSLRVQIPMWLTVMIAAVLPFGWYLGWSRRRSAQLRLCSCGFNLTRLIVHNCPNCGAAVSPPAIMTSPALRATAR